MKHLSLLLLLLFCVGCSSYSSDEAEKNGDIVIGHSNIVNFDKFEVFMEDVLNGKENKIRITYYTDEGDAILNNLDYKNGSIEYTFDNSRDKYGGKGKGKLTTQCQSIESRVVINDEGIERTDYVLTGCQEIIGIHDPTKDEIYLLTKK